MALLEVEAEEELFHGTEMAEEGEVVVVVAAAEPHGETL